MKRRAPNGFTLLELLIAISLLALITGSIMGGLHLGRRTWETSRASEALDEVESAVRSVAALLAQTYPIVIETQQFSPKVQAPFQGLPDASRFIALSEGGAQWGGLILTEIGGEAGRDGAELAIWTRAFRATEGVALPRTAMRKTVVLGDLASFQLSYFGPPEEGRPPVWTATWKNRPIPPSLISVKIGANRLGRVIEASATIAIRQQ